MKKFARLFAGLLALASASAGAQNVLFSEVHTVGAENAPTPIEHAVTLGAAGNYEVVLTDLGAPAAALAEVRLAVTRDNTIVGTPRTEAGTLAFTAPAAGDYVIRIAGRPGSAPGSGLIRVVLRAAGGATLLAEFVDVLSLPAGIPSSGQFVLDARFTVPVTGNYDVTLRDLLWPQAMNTLLVAVVEEGGPLLTALDGVANQPASAALALEASRQYHVFAIAEPVSATAGGLYSLRIAGGGAVPFERNVGVGGVALLGDTTLTAGSHDLTVGDVTFPEALAKLGAHVVRSGQTVASTLAAGTTAFTAVAGVHQVFGFGEPTVAASAGSLRAQVMPQGQPAIFSSVLPVTLPGSGVTPYLFDGAVVAGTYRLQLADYQFPAAFTSLGVAATQGGALLADPLRSADSVNVTTTAGRVQLMVFARAVAAGGLFGVDLVPTGGGAIAIEATQGVGRLFTARKVSVTTATRYDVTLTDVGFPANFTDVSAAVTRGSERVGLIFGPGKFDFSATPGNYFINVIARPAANENSGTYGVAVTDKPPAPVITFAANPTRATTGNPVDLTWTTSNATGCTASNGWTGVKAASGTERTAALTTAATFTLTCTGAGGSSAQTISVDVAPSSGGGSGSGGGGAFDPRTLAALCLVLLLASARRRARLM